MARHSKWSKVKHFKGGIDAKRSRIFAKLSREISMATSLGGGDPDMNPRLRMALLKSREANMPRDNIERAIQRGSGSGEMAQLEDLTYEIYGPHGAAILTELTTDNRNRTSAEIRSILTKNGGTIATAGSVSRLFHRKGQIIISREKANEDELMEIALEAGAEDFRAEPEGYEILTEPAKFEAVHKALESRNIKADAAAVTYVPDSLIPISEPGASEVAKLIELLEEHDDVKEIFTNADLQGEEGQE
ncbi:MAG: YebC/PmpR family DNA-binding transcriptional regulator [Verrucomicrobiota bacterium]